MDKMIKDIYNISLDLKSIPDDNKDSMTEWYFDLINKTYDQLNIFDVTRMLIQKIFLELAIPRAIAFITNDPFCGQRYEGELLEVLSWTEISYLEGYKDSLLKVLTEAAKKNKYYEWFCEDEREEFNQNIETFLHKLL